MVSILEGETFIFIWIGFLLLMSCGIGVFFLWGIRSGQFQDQDRARYLPLQSGIPPAEEPVAPRKQDHAGSGKAEGGELHSRSDRLQATIPLPHRDDGAVSGDSMGGQDSGGAS